MARIPPGIRAFFLPADNQGDMRLGHGFVLFTCALAVAACTAQVKPSPGTDGGAGTGGRAGGTAGSAAGGSTGTAGIISIGGTTGTGGTGGACVPSATCTPQGGRYCGTIGNG